MMRVATSEQCSVSLASLRNDHTPADLLDYVEWLDMVEEMAERDAEEAE